MRSSVTSRGRRTPLSQRAATFQEPLCARTRTSEPSEHSELDDPTLDKTGGVELIVSGLVSGVGDSGPYALLSLLFWLTALLGLFLSNTATSVVMAPIGIQAAQVLGVSPYPLAVAIVVAASAGFASPVSSPVVTLVVAPGRYRFIDFVKVGFPLMLLTYLIALVAIPLLFPFDG